MNRSALYWRHFHQDQAIHTAMSVSKTPPKGNENRWSSADSRTLYNVARWGEGYFDVNASGHLVATPDRNRASGEIDLYELARGLDNRQLDLPGLVHVRGILRDRVAAL